MAYDVASTEAYIRRAAQERGIDPDTAVRVARSEGLARGTWQSNVRHPTRGREPSYGPFQLLVGGQNGWPTGMGNDFVRRTGLDPSDPRNVNATIDFALDGAAQNGWGAWYGAAKVGVGNRDGIGGRRVASNTAPSATPPSTATDALEGALTERSGSNGGGAGLPSSATAYASDGASPMAQRPMLTVGPEKSNKLAEAMIARATADAGNMTHPLQLLGNLAQVWSGNQQIRANDKANQDELEKAMMGAGLDPAYALAAQLGGGREDLAGALLAQQSDRTQAANRAEDEAWRQQQFIYQQDQDAVANSRADQTLDLQRQNTGVPSGYRRTETGLEPIPGGPSDPAIAAQSNFRTLTADEAQQRGLPPGQYQVGPDERIYPIKDSGQSITINNGADEGEFAKQAAGKMATRFATISDGGTAAANVLQTIPQMRELLTIAPQGPVQGRLAEMFPGFSTAGDAFTATVNQIAPTLRIPGSGAQSDKDMDILLGSFPRLRNDPAANTIIMDAFQMKAQINMQRADIANAALRNEIEPAEADRRMAELDRTSIIPEGLRDRLGVTTAPSPDAATNPSNRPRATNPQTGEIIEFDGTQWVPVQ